jgi:hypothetical protein
VGGTEEVLVGLDGAAWLGEAWITPDEELGLVGSPSPRPSAAIHNSMLCETAFRERARSWIIPDRRKDGTRIRCVYVPSSAAVHERPTTER